MYKRVRENIGSVIDNPRGAGNQSSTDSYHVDGGPKTKLLVPIYICKYQRFGYHGVDKVKRGVSCSHYCVSSEHRPIRFDAYVIDYHKNGCGD